MYEREKNFFEAQQWPQYPKLPLVRRQDRELGYLFADEGMKVFLGNIFMPRDLSKTINYTSLDDLFSVWKID